MTSISQQIGRGGLHHLRCAPSREHLMAHLAAPSAARADHVRFRHLAYYQVFIAETTAVYFTDRLSRPYPLLANSL